MKKAWDLSSFKSNERILHYFLGSGYMISQCILSTAEQPFSSWMDGSQHLQAPNGGRSYPWCRHHKEAEDIDKTAKTANPKLGSLRHLLASSPHGRSLHRYITSPGHVWVAEYTLWLKMVLAIRLVQAGRA